MSYSYSSDEDERIVGQDGDIENYTYDKWTRDYNNDDDDKGRDVGSNNHRGRDQYYKYATTNHNCNDKDSSLKSSSSYHNQQQQRKQQQHKRSSNNLNGKVEKYHHEHPKTMKATTALPTWNKKFRAIRKH